VLGAFPAGLTTIETGSLGPPPSTPCTACRTTFAGDNRYAYLQGTSMSTPMVTALGALIRHLNSDLSVAEILQILKRTAQRPHGAAWSADLGWGILDGGAALDVARRVDHRPPQSHLSAPRVTHSRRITLRWSGTDPAPPGLIPSGIDYYEVWRSTNGRPPVRIAVTRDTSLVLTGRRGSSYSFFTIAVDRAGNRESQPAPPYATTRVARRRAAPRHHSARRR
jgi:hypothetical protein